MLLQFSMICDLEIPWPQLLPKHLQDGHIVRRDPHSTALHKPSSWMEASVCVRISTEGTCSGGSSGLELGGEF